jgi:2-oxoglutarate dehydrogenase E2 component (dihydrolipoamide succinyltransferase)
MDESAAEPPPPPVDTAGRDRNARHDSREAVQMDESAAEPPPPAEDTVGRDRRARRDSREAVQADESAAEPPPPAEDMVGRDRRARRDSREAVRMDESAAEPRVTRRKMSMLRRKIATQLVAAQRNAAILTTFNEVDMGGVIDLRRQVQDEFVRKHGVKLGFMSFFLKAACHALQRIPSINARIDGNDILQNHYHDIGVAVGTERGLVVPVVRDVDRKSLADLERDILDHAAKAREGRLTIDDLQGGVFTVSNGGVYGSLLSTPILNPPQSGILGMHTIQERPVARDGQVVIRPMMYLALSYDHRLVDGREAVGFLLEVKARIESPLGLFGDW